MLPESMLRAEFDAAMDQLLADVRMCGDMPAENLESAVRAHAAVLFRLVATVTRSVDRAEQEERRFLDRVRMLDGDPTDEAFA